MSSNENVDAFDTLMQAYTPEDAGGEPEVEVVEEVEDAGEDSTATQEDETTEEGEAETENSDESDENEEEVEDEAPRKGKKSARERINEVIAQRREAERALAAEQTQREALEARLAALEKANKPAETPKAATPAGAEFGIVEPTADDVDDQGELKYPLGEFDPRYVRDLSRYDRAVERAYEAKVAEQRAVQTAAQREAEALFVEWDQKLTAAEATSPEIRQKAEGLEETFKDVPAEHGQALAQSIMALDNGPFVLEYLADNLDEADRIVRMPIQKALIQLGRLDGLFVEEAPKTPPVKATKAPPPPAALARGRGTPSAGGQKSLYDKMLSDFR